ncbi:MAG: OPT/YSL family transporter [Candidatus Bathyarchaeia archaeon]
MWTEVSNRGESEIIKYGEGLTWRSFMAIIYAAVVFLPAAIWVQLTSGAVIGSAIQYTILFLFVQFARYFGSKLTKQEIYIIWSSTAQAGSEAIAIGLLYNLYYRNSPLAMMFKDPYTGELLSKIIPSWYAPPPGSPVVFTRTFLHPDWVMPIFVTLVTYILIFRISDIAVGFITYVLYSRVEKLPFPLQRVAAELCLTMAERKVEKLRVLIICAMIAMAYGALLYGVPFATAFVIVPIPMPWIDFTQNIEVILPGASLGIATDLLTVASGFILPFNVVLSMFIGAIAFYLIGNPLLVFMFPPKEGRLGGLFGWTTGMSLSSIWQWSTLYVWASILIGLALAGGLTPIIRYPKYIFRAFSSLKRLSDYERGSGVPPLWVILSMYFSANIAVIALLIFLVPDFPILILIFLTIVWQFLGAIISGRVLGETGLQISVPYISNAFFLLSGYQKVDIWYTPLAGAVSTGGGTWVLSAYKICELTETKISSWIKAYYLATLIGWAISFLYVSLFWQIAPIPSAAYPSASITWPVSVLMHALWVTRSLQVFRPDFIILSFICGFSIAFICDFLHIPFSLISFFAGAASPIPNSISVMIGAIIAKIIQRRFGKEWWIENRYSVVAGFGLGSGIMMSIAAAIGVIRKSMWILPF